MRKPKIGLALGAGAFRGISHIGVLDVLLDAGIELHCIAGTSIGAVIGAAFVAGMRPLEMEDRANALHERQYYDLVIPRQGILAGEKLKELLRALTNEKRFDEACIPFAVTACDFETMEAVVLDEGPMYEAVRASVSVPAVFVPVERDGRLLVDGAIVDRVPGDVCRRMGADFVIGVDVGYRGQRVRTYSIIEHLIHAFDILEWQVALQRASDVDFMVTPDVLDFDPVRMGGRASECVNRGRAAMRHSMSALMEKLKAYEVEESQTGA